MIDTAKISYDKNSQIINWLKEILEEYSDDQKASFLFFISGSLKKKLI